jgi:hypothetical protein
MLEPDPIEYPVRAGIFSNIDDAKRLLRLLSDAGFSWEHVSVFCSEDKKQRLFPPELQQPLSRTVENQALNAIGWVLFGLTGFALGAALLSSAGTAIVIMGAYAGLAAGGTVAGLMATRGFESEAADYYDQAVQAGRILVAVEVRGTGPEIDSRRNTAARLIAEAGAEPIPLAD